MKSASSLEELGAAGRDAWARRVERCIAEATRQFDIDPPNDFVLAAPDARTPHRTTVDWPGLPLRPVSCLTRQVALNVLDHSALEVGIRPLQEEYIEWRVVGDEEGIARVEFTTEFADYWQVLAAFDPERTLGLVAAFARRDVIPEDIYRGCDPFSRFTTPSDRATAFAAGMLSPAAPGPYNDGRAAITCMAQRSNTLQALVALFLVATNPNIRHDESSGAVRPLPCDESIPLMRGAAQLGRASDPVLVERLGRLAYEGRLVAMDDPLGVYIQSAQAARLRLPNGEPMPADWFRFGRGLPPAETADDRPRWQRVTLEPPPDSGLLVSDLVDVTTEQPIRRGGQIAELIQVAIVARVSDADSHRPGPLKPASVVDPFSDDSRCSDIHRVVERLATEAAS